MRVVITWESAPAETMETQVTGVLEEALAGVEGVDCIRSTSIEGLGSITVHLRPGRNIDIAVQDVHNHVAATRHKLPIEIDPPVVMKERPETLPLIWLTLSGDRPLSEIGAYAEHGLKPRLYALPGVGGSLIAGTGPSGVCVTLDPQRLAAFGLSVTDVAQAIREQQADQAGLVRGQSIQLLPQLVVASRGGTVIFLRDVAAIEAGPCEQPIPARLNGKPVVAIGIQPAPGSDPAAVAAEVHQALPGLRATLPPQIGLELAADFAPVRGRRGPDAIFVELRTTAAADRGAEDRLLQESAKTLNRLEDIESVLTVRLGSTDLAETADTSWLLVQPVPGHARTLAELCARIRQALGELPGARAGVIDLSTQGFPPSRRYPIRLVVQGPELDRLERLADEIQLRLNKNSDAVVDMLSSQRPAIPTQQVSLDRAKLAASGVSLNEAMEAVGLVLGRRRLGARAGDVELRLWKVPDNADHLRRLVVKGRDGHMVVLDQVAEVRMITTPQAIRHYNHERAIEITANPRAGITPKAAAARCREIAEQVLPAGYRVTVVGGG